MVGSIKVKSQNLHSNGSVQNCASMEEKLDELRHLLGKAEGDILKIVQIRIWRRPGRTVDKATAEHLFEVIQFERGCVEEADPALRILKVVTNLQEAVWDADIVVNGLPSTETREVFEEINHYWKERITVPIIISLSKGMVAALTNESATSKSVYFAHCRNAWYGQMLAKGELSLDMGDSISGKGMIQGVSAVGAFYELLSQSSLSVLHPEENKPVAPVELCPILKTLYRILITRELASQGILQALRDETLNDPRERIEIAQTHAFYRPSLLGQP
ncbi:putative glycerol-3-phosphate dehydrogenase [NAD(+)] 1, cytosolic [Vitis vinifera]|uniref:Putative glycerol-3-phosphate dehydrogenase [NAD(+)] 1, cytosolic n=1 Tax=Vitis vinifera TaxID=29760 RepID=A0A438BZS3_VITVI|nr:putative glycerol-3-phosphate dehydrogenase [NAD(+)] 1, cytosolic [Vitis vinifera]